MCGRPAGPGLSQVGLRGLGWAWPGRGLAASQPPPSWIYRLISQMVLGPHGGLGSCVLGEAGRRSSRGPCVSPLLPHHHRPQISTESFLHLRYQGTDCALMVSAHQHPATARSPRAGDFGAAFVERYANAVSGSAGGGLLAWPPCPESSLGAGGRTGT